MEQEDFGMLNQEYDDGSGNNQGTTTTDNYGVHLPAYLGYLSLGFKVISTVIIVLMAGWVIITIRITRSLHKVHNIFVAYLMVIDIMHVTTLALLSDAMMIGYFTGVGDFVSCNVLKFMHYYLGGIIFLTFLIMSLDKVIAITFPFKHHELMKPRVVCGILVAKHLFVVTVHAKHLFAPSSFAKVAQFGTCIPIHDSTILEIMITVVIPIFLACLITIFLDVFLTIKAYRICKRILEESKLSGGHSRDNDQLKALKKKEANIRKNLKPVITLLVVVMGNAIFGLLLPILFIPPLFLDPSEVLMYINIIGYLIIPNIGYVNILLHPFTYALYFKQVREPMMRLLKRITHPCKCKSAAVATQPRSNRINWLNPN